MKILVVEDEDNIATLYKDELTDEGYEVITAKTGAEGLELFTKEKPDLVTLDICMEEKDTGLKVLRQMKAMDPKVPVILLTAFDYRDDFSVWCADAYIVKSANTGELMTTIQRFTKPGG